MTDEDEMMVDLLLTKLRALYRLASAAEWTGGITNRHCSWCGNDKPDHRKDCPFIELVPEKFRGSR